MDELTQRVLQQLGKSEAEFNAEVEELKEKSPIESLKTQNASLNEQVIGLWEALIDGGVIV